MWSTFKILKDVLYVNTRDNVDYKAEVIFLILTVLYYNSIPNRNYMYYKNPSTFFLTE